MRSFRRFLPFTSMSGAAWFAYRHRRPIIDWTTWFARSVPRLADGDTDDVLAELRLRLRLASDERLGGDRINVEVQDGRALLSGDVARGHRKVIKAVAHDAKGVERVSDVLHERSRGRPVPA
jgi:hypothetical protein